MNYKGLAALVTGASGGLGEAFAWQLAERGCDVVLVARSEGKMKALAQGIEAQFGGKAMVIPADLTSPAGVKGLISEIHSRQLQIDLLVNNAGFGIFEDFLDVSLDRELQQIDLDVRALVALTHAFARGMVARHSGGIINIASAAGFQPLAGADVYAAAKSFVILFSEALAQEFSKAGVHVLAVCPGPVATAFYDDKHPAIAREQMDQPGPIVAEALRAFERGRRVLIPGKISNWINAFAVRFAPRAFVTRIAEGKLRKLNRREPHPAECN